MNTRYGWIMVAIALAFPPFNSRVKTFDLKEVAP